MRPIRASLLDNGASEEQERRILVKGEVVFVSDCRLSFGRLSVNLFLSTVSTALMAERISRAERAVKQLSPTIEA
jgi:hypothetical protein